MRNQARPLEIPVTIQGSKTVEGTDRRELFTETTNTTLVFENGAVLKLNAKVSPGQSVFLRNDQSEKEILCKVLESRQAGYTDLEFTVYDPNFWDLAAKQPAAPAPTPEPKNEMEAPMDVSDPAPSVVSSAPANEEVPATVQQTPPKAPASTSPQPKDEAIPPDWDEAKDAELHAVLAAMDASSKAQSEFPQKETKPSAPEAAAQGVRKQSEASSDKTHSNTTTKATVLSTPASQARGLRAFSAAQNPIAVRIAACVLVAAALGFAWHATTGLFHGSARPSVASTQSAQARQQAPVVTPASQTAPSAGATNAQNSAATLAQTAQRIQQQTQPERPVATAANAGAQWDSKGTQDSAASATPMVAATGNSGSPDQATLAPSINSSETKTGEITPAKIVSQTPPAIPEWAKALDIEQVVKLDALIDEKGNVVESKPLSGPRLLQPAAQRAVTLWVFEPALSDGKPIATRMVLTVQFQK